MNKDTSNRIRAESLTVDIAQRREFRTISKLKIHLSSKKKPMKVCLYTNQFKENFKDYIQHYSTDVASSGARQEICHFTTPTD